ncbi:PHB1 / prohibitin 1 [Leishmania donovani]|uniref:Prohibitin n=3 Tax=Leishmania donovani species complex TaxID=38574 RepID=A0A6L0WZW0_LEIIN|nr:prohibitin [Leishmania infantum JPCM5]XP_003859855.1 prohibitin [Leishmania donovani]CAC9476544.1 prohibitin [Leishmania infantum]AYU77748.1 prohibitin [Leishmania donovani]TPP41050.1 SPFH domain / Band 7 family protein [Leishmania donovani]TPP51084.1 SPFH domain / Band 7 family protein [Leishmania donovani]CAJ1987758.1 PHB1 / prohibitin 1 [Leishmania donovani]|eukprot:XP_001464650.1 prohibitin [Leishmania infantum JPCM5]
MSKLLQKVAIGAMAAGLSVYSCCFVVYPGEACILYNKISGLKDSVYGEGLQGRIIGLDEVLRFNVRVRPRTLHTMTGTKDLQMVNVRLRVLFRPMADRLPQIYRTFGLDYDERILPSVSNEILKAVVAEYKAEELIQKRDAVSARIYQLMQEKVNQFGLIIEDLSLVDIQFGADFMTAVEQKQVAQQEAERYRYVVMENEQKRRAAVVRAEGEAESARLISEAIQKSGSGLLELRRIEAAVEVANQIVPMQNVTFVPKDANMLMSMSR